jgi:hypothetical protein
VLDKSLGSRHRAALGITEETDAVVVVVSEERGTIGFCFNGNIVSHLDGASLRQALLGLFGQKTRGNKRAVKRTTGAPASQRASVVPSSSPTPASANPSSREGVREGMPVRDGNTGSVILPRNTRESLAPPPPSTPPRALPGVTSRTDPSAKLMPAAELPPGSGNPKDEG